MSGNRKAAKYLAQEMLMHGIGNVMGYWTEDANRVRDVKDLGMSQDEFGAIMLREADRAAKLFGYDQAWTN
jgi:hypothetical protein